MDTLTCRSPARCATCAHFDAPTGCALELDLHVALAALATPKTPANPAAKGTATLLMVDLRRVHA